MATGAAEAVAEAWKRLTVTASTDAEALGAAADCARAVTGEGLRVPNRHFLTPTCTKELSRGSARLPAALPVDIGMPAASAPA